MQNPCCFRLRIRHTVYEPSNAALKKPKPLRSAATVLGLNPKANAPEDKYPPGNFVLRRKGREAQTLLALGSSRETQKTGVVGCARASVQGRGPSWNGPFLFFASNERYVFPRKKGKARQVDSHNKQNTSSGATNACNSCPFDV
jgi:hypothetical protein